MSNAKPLRGSRCPACETVYFPPRGHCVQCSDNRETEEVGLSGKGTLYSITNLHLGSIAPCSVGYVDLDEGVRCLARFEAVDDPADFVGAERRVTVGFGPEGGDTERVVLGWLDPV